jgi:hypothetical protein
MIFASKATIRTMPSRRRSRCRVDFWPFLAQERPFSLEKRLKMRYYRRVGDGCFSSRKFFSRAKEKSKPLFLTELFPPSTQPQENLRETKASQTVLLPQKDIREENQIREHLSFTYLFFLPLVSGGHIRDGRVGNGRAWRSGPLRSSE